MKTVWAQDQFLSGPTYLLPVYREPHARRCGKGREPRAPEPWAAPGPSCFPAWAARPWGGGRPGEWLPGSERDVVPAPTPSGSAWASRLEGPGTEGQAAAPEDAGSSRLSARSPGAVQPAGQVPPAAHRLHQPAAAGAGAPVQAQQVPVAAQALRGGHVADAHGDPGEPAARTRLPCAPPPPRPVPATEVWSRRGRTCVYDPPPPRGGAGGSGSSAPERGDARSFPAQPPVPPQPRGGPGGEGRRLQPQPPPAPLLRPLLPPGGGPGRTE